MVYGPTLKPFFVYSVWKTICKATSLPWRQFIFKSSLWNKNRLLFLRSICSIFNLLIFWHRINTCNKIYRKKQNSKQFSSINQVYFGIPMPWKVCCYARNKYLGYSMKDIENSGAILTKYTSSLASQCLKFRACHACTLEKFRGLSSFTVLTEPILGSSLLKGLCNDATLWVSNCSGYKDAHYDPVL